MKLRHFTTVISIWEKHLENCDGALLHNFASKNFIRKFGTCNKNDENIRETELFAIFH